MQRSLENARNALDATTFDASTYKAPEMGHPWFMNGSHTCCWFSANSGAIDFNQGLKCSSRRNELSSLQCLDLRLTSKGDGAVYLDIQIISEIGQLVVHSHLTTSVFSGQASNLQR